MANTQQLPPRGAYRPSWRACGGACHSAHLEPRVDGHHPKRQVLVVHPPEPSLLEHLQHRQACQAEQAC